MNRAAGSQRPASQPQCAAAAATEARRGRQALKAPGDEYARVLDMVGRYAVFKAGTGFSVKKQARMRRVLGCQDMVYDALVSLHLELQA